MSGTEKIYISPPESEAHCGSGAGGDRDAVLVPAAYYEPLPRSAERKTGTDQPIVHDSALLRALRYHL